MTVLENTRLSVITNTPIKTTKIHEGEPLTFLLEEDVLVDDLLVIPRGATFHGSVVQVRKAGKLTGSPNLILKLVSLDLEGRSYPLYCYEFMVEGTSKTPPTKAKIKTGSATGTVIGAVVGGALDASTNETGTPSVVGTLAGMGTGAAVGAGVGTVVAAASPGPVIDIPAESQIDFFLASPISVVPVSRREAQRLSEGLYSGGPVLYLRGETP
ncbi:MAG TPA: glycine zipper family protein [Terracidiphilus sp.]|nr:glycine zipper family protein [Terracidiphilus sp.]